MLFYRVKCYLIVKDVLNALNYMKMMLDIKKDPKIAFDYEILECLRECSDESFQDFRGIIDRMKAAEVEAKGEYGVIVE